MNSPLTESTAATDAPAAEPITFYEPRFYPFSNFSSFAVFYEGRLWPTSEHAYQGMKFMGRNDQELIRAQTSAHEAMKLAQSMKDKRRPDWDVVKVPIMLDVCRAKLHQHSYVQGKVVESGSRLLIEASPIDGFWGWGPDRTGENHLGRIWMTLRDEWNAQLPSMVEGRTEGQQAQFAAMMAMSEELKRQFGHLPYWWVITNDADNAVHEGFTLDEATHFIQAEAGEKNGNNTQGIRIQLIFPSINKR